MNAQYGYSAPSGFGTICCASFTNQPYAFINTFADSLYFFRTYYSTEDTVNTVNLETKRLRITTINLVNSEKLSLDWSSNVGADLGVDYEVSFYKNDDNTKLFTLRVSPFDMGQQGWSTNADSTSGMATLELTKADGTKDTSNWMLSYRLPQILHPDADSTRVSGCLFRSVYKLLEVLL